MHGIKMPPFAAPKENRDAPNVSIILLGQFVREKVSNWIGGTQRFLHVKVDAGSKG